MARAAIRTWLQRIGTIKDEDEDEVGDAETAGRPVTKTRVLGILIVLNVEHQGILRTSVGG